MVITFDKDYLRTLYTDGKDDKKHRYQPQIIKKYIAVVNLMKSQKDVMGLMKYVALNYEHLQGDKKDFSSVRINDQYRIEFKEYTEGDNPIATICNITELSNHYK